MLERGRVVEIGKHDELVARPERRLRAAAPDAVARDATRSQGTASRSPPSTELPDQPSSEGRKHPMIKSMTGFASLTRDDERGTIGVTIRAVNHRFLDLQLRLPTPLASTRTVAARAGAEASGAADASRSACRCKLARCRRRSIELNAEFAQGAVGGDGAGARARAGRAAR